MMEFNDDKPIYRQIVDHAYNLILSGSWAPGERVPSVRELAASLGVNTRTVLKAMEDLQAEEMIFSRRGMGFSLAEDAVERVKRRMQKEFFETTVPRLRSDMEALGIPISDLIRELER